MELCQKWSSMECQGHMQSQHQPIHSLMSLQVPRETDAACEALVICTQGSARNAVTDDVFCAEQVQAQLLQFAAKNIGLNPALLTSPVNPQHMTMLNQLYQLQLVSGRSQGGHSVGCQLVFLPAGGLRDACRELLLTERLTAVVLSQFLPCATDRTVME